KPNPTQIIHNASNMKPMNTAEVLETLNSQTTGANPTKSRPESATIEHNIPTTALNRASNPPMQVKM
ncbi:MAG TPA: hypothetical protein DGJ56_10710, partial [Verrucomicrobiales bacterium]|nr:hypothetical protein [Verrucomicrobiales bacterium]